MTEQETDAYEYTLNIIAVKMSVKFPCKMRLDHNGSPVTSEISTNESHKFVFNQELSLKQDSEKQYLQITVTLITEKGGKYIAGLLKIFHTELLDQEGECITVPLTKCLDSEAFCELRVDQVITTKETRQMSGSQVQRRPTQADSPSQLSPPVKIRVRNGDPLIQGTKSELNFPLSNKKPKQEWQDSKTRLNVAQSFLNRKPNSRSPMGHRLQPGHEHRFEQMSAVIDNRDKLIEAEVYKEGYNKLKDKYKKEAENAKLQLNKRINLENSENNLKLQIMRIKLKNEEQQKNINEKNLKIKQLQGQISNFQKKELDLVYLKEEYSSKDHTIRMLEDSNRSLSRENEDLRNQSIQRTLKDQDRIKDLKRQLQQLKTRSDAKETELQKQLRNKVQDLRIKDAELQAKIDLLNREKKAVQDLQRQLQNRLMDYERNFQLEKATAKTKHEQIKLKLDKTEKDKSNLSQQHSSLTDQLERTKASLLKSDYENKILMQEVESLKKESAELKIYKDKHSEITRELKVTTDDRNHFQKQLERALQNKEVNITQLSKQHQQQIDYFKKVNKQLDDKLKNFTTRIIELEGQVEAGKGAHQKLKRMQDTLNAELNDARERQKSLKKTLNKKEQQILALESDISNVKQKNKSGQHFLKHQLDQYKEQLERLRTQFQDQSMRCAQLTENNAQLNVDLGKTKVKLQFMQQKSEKDTAALKERKIEVQTMSRDHEAQIGSLNDTITSLRQIEKDLISKIQKQEIQSLRTQDKLQRITKESKLLEQKLTTSEHSMKNKHGEHSSLTAVKNDLQARVGELQRELSAARTSESQLQAEKAKNQKMLQILQEEVNKLKKDGEKLRHAIEDKEKDIQSLHNDIKKNKEDITKTEMKLNTVTADFQRYRESVMDTMNSTFSAVVSDGKKHLGSSVVLSGSDGFGSRKNLQSSSVVATTSQINHLILSYSKDVKLAINKLGEQNKQLQRQNQRLNDQLSGSITKGQTSQYQMSKQMQQLQEELNGAYMERDQENLKFDQTLKDLNAKIREKDRQINDLNEQLQEANFNLNTMQLDYQAQSSQNSKKNTQMKRSIEETEEKNDLLSLNVATLEERVFTLESEKEALVAQLRQERDGGYKKDRSLIEVNDRTEQLQRMVEEGKRQRKELLQKNSELQLELNTERENYEKQKQLLEEQEGKAGQLKGFINSLMKQKEQAIKSQLEKGQQIIALEGSLLQMTRDRDILNEQVERLRKQIDEGKDSIKKTSGTLKDTETRIAQERTRNQKLAQRLRDKEKQIVNLQQNIQKLQAKCSRLTERALKEGGELREELESKTNDIISLTKDNSQKCFQYEREKQNMEATISKLKAEVMGLEEQLFNQRQSYDGTNSSLEATQKQTEGLRARIAELQLLEQNLSEEIRMKQQVAFELQGNIYNLEVKIDAKENQKNDRVALLDNEWVNKFEGMCEQYEQRIELVQKQRDYFKKRLNQQEDQFKKLSSEKSQIQIDENKLKTVLEQKIRKLQQERLHLATQKNSEIQRLAEEVKSQQDQIKNKDTETRKTLHELQVARNTITKLDAKSKDNDQKMKNMNKVYQAELEQLKKREGTYKTIKEAVSQQQWSAERDVRRVVQVYQKKIVESADPRSSQRILDSMKNFEQALVDAMKLNLDIIK